MHEPHRALAVADDEGRDLRGFLDGERLPLVPISARMDAAILEISAKGFGCVVVVRDDGTLAGIVTDGDLRRNLTPDLMTLPVTAIMTKTPRTIAPDALVASALEMEEASRITALIVV